jgi:hypothetical protein
VIKIKNVGTGILMITDAGLKLAPGGTDDVENITPQMQRCLDDGLLARVDTEPEVKTKSKPSTRSSAAKTEAKEQSSKADGNEKGGAADSGEAGQSSEPETASAGQQAANGKLALDAEVK